MWNAQRGGGLRDELRTGGTGGVRPRDDELADERPQGRQEGAFILVGAHPDDNGCRVSTKIIAPGLDKGSGGGRRVRAIENENSVPDSDPLKAPRPAGGCESGADGRFRKVN